MIIFSTLNVVAQTSETSTTGVVSEFDESALALQKQFDEMRSSTLLHERLQANAEFIPQLVKTLKKKDSYDYPFKQLDGLSILNAPDNTFRIITWFVPLCDTLPEEKRNDKLEQFGYRYYGAIQLNSDEGLNLLPLYDVSDSLMTPEEEILSNDNWYGAVYYNMIQRTHAGKDYYILFGWEGNNSITSTKKLAEVLTFKNGKPVFGAPIFEFFRDDYYMNRNRMILEYKKDSGVSLNYNDQKEMIVYDYIKPESPEAKGNYYLYIPDGTYEGLIYTDGIWKHEKKVFNVTSTVPLQVDEPKKTGSSNANNDQNSPPKRKKTKKWWQFWKK